MNGKNEQQNSNKGISFVDTIAPFKRLKARSSQAASRHWELKASSDPASTFPSFSWTRKRPIRT